MNKTRKNKKQPHEQTNHNKKSAITKTQHTHCKQQQNKQIMMIDEQKDKQTGNQIK